MRNLIVKGIIILHICWILMIGNILVLHGQSMISIRNHSFEDVPHMGGISNELEIKEWLDCGFIKFPGETPPDIHPNAFWEVENKPSHGNTYLGMVVRDNDSWESVSQRLNSSLKSGKCYRITIDLAQSKRYISQSRRNVAINQNSNKVNYNIPAVLRIWGGNSMCGQLELLAESKSINHDNWVTYEFEFEVFHTVGFVTLEAFYKVPVLVPYNGHILLDDMSEIYELNCKTGDPLVDIRNENKIVSTLTKAKPRNPLPTKGTNIKGNQVVSQNNIRESETKLDKGNPVNKDIPKINAALEKENIKVGKTIRIERLYFRKNSYKILDESFETLDEIFKFLDENKNIVIEIGGHTNGNADSKYAIKLSTNRAKEVAIYLMKKGISPKRLTYIGYGRRFRIASDKTEEGRQKNQRVEIKILSVNFDQ